MFTSLFETHTITFFSSSLLVSSDILLTLLSLKILALGSQSALLDHSLLFICLMTTFTLMNQQHCHRLAPMLFSILALQSSPQSSSLGLPWTNACKNSPLLFNYTHYSYFKLLLDIPVLCFLYVFTSLIIKLIFYSFYFNNTLSGVITSFFLNCIWIVEPLAVVKPLHTWTLWLPKRSRILLVRVSQGHIWATIS